MKKVLAILIFQLGIISSIFACGCSGPKNNIRTDIDSSYAIFIGIITEINQDHIFHLNDGIGTGLKFINFDVLRSYRGLNQAQLKVTLFDSASNSSCEGIVYGKEIGDTVLVFADEFLPEMLGSYLCGRHSTFQRLSAEEVNFVDTVKWIDPRTKYINSEEFLREEFPELNQSKRKENKNSDQGFLRSIMYLSIAINLILGFIILRNKINAR